MTTEKTLSEQWEILTQKLVKDFSLPMQLDIDRVLYMIGIQELGKPHEVFSKEDKVNLIHIATCCVYTAGGYMYEVDFVLFGEYLMRLAKLLNPYHIKDSVYIQLHRQGEILDQLLG